LAVDFSVDIAQSSSIRCAHLQGTGVNSCDFPERGLAFYVVRVVSPSATILVSMGTVRAEVLYGSLLVSSTK
jgi:hypothetical protein